MLKIGDAVQLEARVQEAGKKCADYSLTHGVENPELLIEYGKALFEIAKHSASLVDQKQVDEKQMPRENPNVKIALPEDFEEPSADEGEDDKEDNENNENNENNEEDEEVDDENAQEDAEAEVEDDFAEAFQIIDLARVLYEKLPDGKEKLLKLANTRSLLGDISLEDDNPEQAIDDITAASEYKKELFGELSGEYSESEFMLSLAYESVGHTEDSLAHLKNAAKAAKAAELNSASELEQRVQDVEQELALQKKLKGTDTTQAKKATQDSITGRSAIATAVQGMVSGANDITQLARKRKRPADKPAKK